MNENIKDLYSKIEFTVNGGAVKNLTDFLNEEKIKALVVEKTQSGLLNVLDASGIVPESLTMKDDVSEYFSHAPVKEHFEIDFCEEKSWPGIFRIRGEGWEVFILCKNKPGNCEKFIEELRPYGGLIKLWQNFKNISETEKKLSRLSYMILATKSTLASIFEPVPMKYFASFLSDVLKESLFPKSLVILNDDGKNLTLITGNCEKIPEHEGIYTAQILPPAPVVTKNDSPCEVVLPIIESSSRMFCVMQWENLPDEQAMNFLELLGNLAARAIVINNLRLQTQKIAENVSAGIIELEKRLKGVSI